MITKNL